MVCLQCGMTTFQFLETKTQIQAHNGIRVIKQGRSRKTLSLSLLCSVGTGLMSREATKSFSISVAILKVRIGIIKE